MYLLFTLVICCFVRINDAAGKPKNVEVNQIKVKCLQDDIEKFNYCSQRDSFKANITKCFTDNKCSVPNFEQHPLDNDAADKQRNNSCVKALENDIRSRIQQCVDNRVTGVLELANFESHMNGILPRVILENSFEPMPNENDPLPTKKPDGKLPAANHTTPADDTTKICPAFENVTKCIQNVKPQMCEAERRCMKLQKLNCSMQDTQDLVCKCAVETFVNNGATFDKAISTCTNGRTKSSAGFKEVYCSKLRRNGCLNMAGNNFKSRVLTGNDRQRISGTGNH